MKRQITSLRNVQNPLGDDEVKIHALKGKYLTFPMFIEILVKCSKFVDIQKQINERNRDTMFLKPNKS